MRPGTIPAPGSDRVPSDLALYMLAQHGIRIRPATLRTWTRRGHIVRHKDGYEIGKIMAIIDARHADQTRGT